MELADFGVLVVFDLLAGDSLVGCEAGSLRLVGFDDVVEFDLGVFFVAVLESVVGKSSILACLLEDLVTAISERAFFRPP